MVVVLGASTTIYYFYILLLLLYVVVVSATLQKYDIIIHLLLLEVYSYHETAVAVSSSIGRPHSHVTTAYCLHTVYTLPTAPPVSAATTF